MVDFVRRNDVPNGTERFELRCELRTEEARRMKEQAAVSQSDHRHPRAQRNTEERECGIDDPQVGIELSQDLAAVC